MRGARIALRRAGATKRSVRPAPVRLSGAGHFCVITTQPRTRRPPLTLSSTQPPTHAPRLLLRRILSSAGDSYSLRSGRARAAPCFLRMVDIWPSGSNSAAKMAAPMVAQTAKRSFSAVQQVIELSNYLEQRISATAAEASGAEYAETGKVSFLRSGWIRGGGVPGPPGGKTTADCGHVAQRPATPKSLLALRDDRGRPLHTTRRVNGWCRAPFWLVAATTACCLVLTSVRRRQRPASERPPRTHERAGLAPHHPRPRPRSHVLGYLSRRRYCPCVRPCQRPGR